DEGRGEPISLLAAIEDDLQAAQAQSHETEARPVHRRLLAGVAAGRALMDQAAHQGEDPEADRNVDEEDPAPIVTVSDPTAERRTDCRSNDGGDAVDCRGHAPFLGR